MENPVGIDIEGYFNLGHSPRGAINPGELEVSE
jgi:hypothetical protein